jgi:hypothetical protein
MQKCGYFRAKSLFYVRFSQNVYTFLPIFALTKRYNMELKYKDAIKGINQKFEYYLSQYKQLLKEEGVYVKAFNHYMVLIEHGVMPDNAAKFFNEMTKLHFGYDLSEIQEIAYKKAIANTREIQGLDYEILSDNEAKALERYHEILFGDYVKKTKQTFIPA